MVRPERRVLLAGARPVRVSAGAPGSRPQAKAEMPTVRAGRRKSVKRRARKRAATSSERCSQKRSILRNPRAWYRQRRESPKATKRLRDRVREITDSRQSGQEVKRILAKLNPVLRGWGNYFRTGTCSREFHKMDDFVYLRLVRWLTRRGGQRPTKRALWTSQQLHDMGLYRLRGHVRYAAQAATVRSSLSRVRENRTHGLKGDIRNGLA